MIVRRADGKPTGRYENELLKVGLPFCGFTVLSRLLARAEIFLLFAFVSAAATAEYTLAQRTALLTMMISLAADAAFRPTIARAFTQGQYDQAASQFLCVSRSILMVCLPVFLLLTLFPARVMAVIGEQFINAAPVVTLITIGTMANFAFGPVASALAMAGLTQKNLRNGLVAGAIGLALDLTLIPKLGIVGAAIAQSVSMIALASINAFSAYRATGVLGIGKMHLKLVIAAAVATIAGLIANSFIPQNKYAAFVILASAIFSSYGVTLALIKPAPEDLQLLKSIFIEHDR
jgi:O-antigen/teichoic acid export membrane protein